MAKSLSRKNRQRGIIGYFAVSMGTRVVAREIRVFAKEPHP